MYQQPSTNIMFGCRDLFKKQDSDVFTPKFQVIYVVPIPTYTMEINIVETVFECLSNYGGFMQKNLCFL